MKRLYKHEVINVAGQDVGSTIDLSRIVAIGPIFSLTFKVTLTSGKSIEVVALYDEQRDALIAAWEAWLAQEAGKL
jgi:hypothetical protein